MNDYYPFGGAFNSFTRSYSEAQNFKYNGKELDPELDWYHYGFRIYDPWIGRFPSIDPIADKFAHVSPYNYAENEPVGSIDLWGLQRWKVNGYERTSAPSTLWTKYTLGGATSARERRRIGSPGFGKINITQNTSRLPIHLSDNRKNLTRGRGSETNAVRHTLWSGAIASALDGGTAKRVTDAKEGILKGSTSEIDLQAQFEGDLDLADNIVDLMNNEIGIEIGSEHSGDLKSLTVKVLDVFKEEGLWTATEKDGEITFKREKISQKQYDRAIEILSTLDQNGMNQQDREKVKNAQN